VAYFIITPDSRRVIYSAEQEVDNRLELYSVPIEGGPATKLNGALPTGGNVTLYQADADTGRVVYVADQAANDVYELYSVPAEGGPFVRLNLPLVSGGNVYVARVDPISDRVVYSADQDTDGLFELYSVPITGGMAVKLNLPTLVSIVSSFEITPGAAYVMFVASTASNNITRLYGVSTAGGMVHERSHDLDTGQYVSGFRLSPDGSQVVYRVVQQGQGGGNLYQTDPFSGTPHVLTVAEPGFGVGFYDFKFAPDGDRILCIYQYDAASPQKLISVKTTGFPVVQADLFTPAEGHLVGLVQTSPDSDWVVYEDYVLANNAVTLWAVPTTGGQPVGFGSGFNPVITPDSQRVVYIAPQEGYPRDLMSTQIFGGGQRNLSRLEGYDGVTQYQVSPDGQWIAFAVSLHNGSGETIGYQLRASDGTEPPPVFRTFLPVAQR
jgi:Tol biopolymer transport system component